ncbi:TIGR03943 family protein [Mycobacterium barrassiae]|uniref:TIGR03943 family putative permease subunit n=1 Tax=Mycobacterium barrassiae TaxID=319709 RepID=UPI002265A626|nr:TIGR03943 family protein [Mycobacterium barrassiae]MCV7298146.1 TIGR03943 family protein [Mycobacterium barrassiae]
MTRETENAILLLVGITTGIITITGAYTRYVKPSLLPWLAASAILLITLAMVAIVRDIRQGSAHEPHDDGHVHRRWSVWLLVVPIAVLGFIVPPAITPEAAAPTVTEVSPEALRRPFPALPDERAPELSLPEVLVRIARDSAHTLDGRLITVIGSTFKADGRTDLARVVIICCAADASLARIRVSGPAAAQIAGYPENTWLRVEGKVPPGQTFSREINTAVIEVYSATRIDPPANLYEY